MPRILSEKGLRREAVVATQRSRRRGKMLSMCATFFRSLCEQSDSEVRLSGRRRCDLAQAQHALALDLADSIDKEIVCDRRFDENNNAL